MLPFGHQRRTCGQDYVRRYRCGYTHAKRPPTHVKFQTIDTSERKRAVMIVFLLLEIHDVLRKILTLTVQIEMIKTSCEYKANANAAR